MNAAVILPAAPFRGAGGAEIRFAVLHNGDDAFTGGASELSRDAREVVIEQRQDSAGRVGWKRLAFVAQRDMRAKKLLGASIGRGFVPGAFVDCVQRVVGRDIERLLPIVERYAELVGAISGQSRQHQDVGVSWMTLEGRLQFFQRLGGLAGIQQLSGASE